MSEAMEEKIWNEWIRDTTPRIMCIQAPYIEAILLKAGLISSEPRVITDGSMSGEACYWRQFYDKFYDASSYLHNISEVRARREKIKALSPNTLLCISPLVKIRKERECAIIWDGVTNAFLVNFSGLNVIKTLQESGPLTLKSLAEKLNLSMKNLLPFIKWLLVFGICK